MATAAESAARAADAASRAAARPINAATGGSGGTVVLIAGVLFLGYLFVTRRLQAVLAALRSPVDSIGSTVQPDMGAPARPGSLDGALRRQGATPPIAPMSVDPFAECVKYQMSIGRTRAQAEAKCASQRVGGVVGRFVG